MKKMEVTLTIIKQKSKVLLAYKKRGFGTGYYNGVGGKVDLGETVEQAMIRETEEEIGVTPIKFEKAAILTYDEFYKGEPALLTNHVYIATEYKGTPVESDEMRPQWFDIDKIPFTQMFTDDYYWLPQVLRGEKIRGFFKFDKDFNILEHKVEIVETI